MLDPTASSLKNTQHQDSTNDNIVNIGILILQTFKRFELNYKIKKKGEKQMHQQETISKMYKYHFKRGTLLILALVLGAMVWLRPSQVAMTDTSNPEVVLSDTDSSEQDQELRNVDPPDPDDREVDPPDPDLSDREVDPPDPDSSRDAVDPPDPDLVP